MIEYSLMNSKVCVTILAENVSIVPDPLKENNESRTS